jgi:hypothetical protein
MVMPRFSRQVYSAGMTWCTFPPSEIQDTLRGAYSRMLEPQEEFARRGATQLPEKR